MVWDSLRTQKPSQRLNGDGDAAFCEWLLIRIEQERELGATEKEQEQEREKGL